MIVVPHSFQDSGHLAHVGQGGHIIPAPCLFAVGWLTESAKPSGFLVGTVHRPFQVHLHLCHTCCLIEVVTYKYMYAAGLESSF